MSDETITYLNENTLIGMTEKEGNAWRYTGQSDNHYPGPIPLADVKARLFNWHAEYRGIYLSDINVDREDDDEQDLPIFCTTHKALVRDLGGTNLQVFNFVTDIHAIHQYDEWLLDNVAVILDEAGDDMLIGSAGQLKNGAQAWVQIRPPEVVTVGGDQMLVWLLAATSHDGSLSTTYKWVVTRVVCDNTLMMGMSEGGAQFKVKHTKGNSLQIAKAREILDIFWSYADGFTVEVEQLMNTTVSTDQMVRAVKGTYGDRPEESLDDDGNVTNRRAMNNWDARFEEIIALYEDDPRVKPWTGTYWGAVQANNTWNHWGVQQRSTNQRDRADVTLAQMTGMVGSKLSDIDRTFRSQLDTVLAG